MDSDFTGKAKGGISFCIITAGKKRDKLENLLNSIRSQNREKFEIIISGNLPEPIQDVIYLPMLSEAATGQISKMRNVALSAARYELIVLSDDDMVFDAGFAAAIENYEKDFDILCVKLRNPDGSRCWDWATVGGPSGHRLMSYDENDDYTYVTGGLLIIKKKSLALGMFNEDLGFYAGEDVEFSHRMKSRGAKIEFCRDTGVLHDDPTYTQFDDYTRKIINFNQWDVLTPEVRAKGVYTWGGKAYPMTETVVLSLENIDSMPKSIEFNVAPLEKDFYSESWKCRILHDRTVLKESDGNNVFSFAVQLQPGESRALTIECSDTTVAFSKGAFRDQRTVAAYLLKPQVRQPQAEDLIVPEINGFAPDAVFLKHGIAVFAPCMGFGGFSAATRAMVRDFAVYGLDFGLEFHSVDFWFSKLCFSFDSSSREWTEYLKRRKYAGVNLVCASQSAIKPGFFNRAISARPGYAFNMAVTEKIADPEIIEELKKYDQIFTYEYDDCMYFRSAGIRADLLNPKNYFNQSAIKKQRKLQNQRSQPRTLLLDRFSYFETNLNNLLNATSFDQDVSIVLYVVDDFQTLQSIIKKVEQMLSLNGQQERISQLIITSGTLEAVEELEFLRFSETIDNLLSGSFAEKVNLRLATPD